MICAWSSISRDHGAAFWAWATDTNHDSAELIPLPQLQSAFQKSGLKVDFLGFDACLMASLEVARVVQPFADYLLASQELEPGHGWHYGDFLNALLNTPDIPSLGKTMIDSFITHSSHQKTRNKTLSLTDLKQIPTLLSSLDAFVSQLPANTPVPVLPSLQATPEFGVQSRGGVVSPSICVNLSTISPAINRIRQVQARPFWPNSNRALSTAAKMAPNRVREALRFFRSAGNSNPVTIKISVSRTFFGLCRTVVGPTGGEHRAARTQK